MAKDTKERILAAALEMFSQNGYAGTNVRELTASLGLVKSSMYRHFESKEEIWNALLDGLIAYYGERFGSPEHLPPVPESREGLVELTMRLVDFTVHDETIVKTRKLLTIEQFRDERARELASRYFLTGLTEMFTPLFAGMMDKGLLRRDDPAMLAFAYTSPISALIHLCDREPEKTPEALTQIEAFSRHFIRNCGDGKRKAVLYVHGKNGSAAESERFSALFPDRDIMSLDYEGETPWEAGAEIRAVVRTLRQTYDEITLIANSIGAYFCMDAGIGGLLQKAYFISPIVDMEELIARMLEQAGVSEAELEAKVTIPTDSGEELSWEYLRYVRSHPVDWEAPTEILYGSGDVLTPPETIRSFAESRRAGLTVMEGGEHWFHTEEQMRFLDRWIENGGAEK